MLLREQWIYIYYDFVYEELLYNTVLDQLVLNLPLTVYVNYVFLYALPRFH